MDWGPLTNIRHRHEGYGYSSARVRVQSAIVEDSQSGNVSKTRSRLTAVYATFLIGEWLVLLSPASPPKRNLGT